MNEKGFTTAPIERQADVIAFYDRYAQTWDSRFGSALSTEVFLEQRWASFSSVMAGVPVRDRALELGVGTGVHIGECSKLFGQITAVDGSGGMLQVLRERMGELGVRNVEMVCSDVGQMEEIGTREYDVVYFFGLLEHIVDVSQFVTEIHRVLKSGGHLVGVTPNGVSPWYRLRRLIRGTGKHCATDTYYTEDGIAQVFPGDMFQLKALDYWGAVPAGINSRAVTAVLRAVGVGLEGTVLQKWLGGITFDFVRI
ncbi:class I SAM-dependent methyltransferase [Candidatus Latescibacterota bacterium]